MLEVCFLHGLESGPDGLKIRVMREAVEALGCVTQAPDFRFTRDPEVRASHLLGKLDDNRSRVLVGSSLGGFVAARATQRLAEAGRALPVGLFLLCPAFDLAGYPLDRPAQPLRGDAVFLVHGRRDMVVPLAHSRRAAEAWQATLLELDDDHPLHASAGLIAAQLALFVRRLS